jgi:hypothetical protein
MTDGRILEAAALDGLADLLDVVDKGGGTSTNKLTSLAADGRVTVEILTADGNTGDKTVELVAVLVNRLLEGLDLIVEGLRASRGPDTEENAGLSLDGSRNGRDWLVIGVALL